MCHAQRTSKTLQDDAESSHTAYLNQLLSRILTWKSDFGLFGLGFYDDSFVQNSQKRASDEFRVSKTNEKNNNFLLTWNFGQFVQICLDSPGSLDLSNSI